MAGLFVALLLGALGRNRFFSDCVAWDSNFIPRNTSHCQYACASGSVDIFSGSGLRPGSLAPQLGHGSIPSSGDFTSPSSAVIPSDPGPPASPGLARWGGEARDRGWT